MPLERLWLNLFPFQASPKESCDCNTAASVCSGCICMLVCWSLHGCAVGPWMQCGRGYYQLLWCQESPTEPCCSPAQRGSYLKLCSPDANGHGQSRAADSLCPPARGGDGSRAGGDSNLFGRWRSSLSCSLPVELCLSSCCLAEGARTAAAFCWDCARSEQLQGAGRTYNMPGSKSHVSLIKSSPPPSRGKAKLIKPCWCPAAQGHACFAA